jgi:serine/threonine protein kinase
MSDITSEKLAQRIMDSGVLDVRQIESVWSELGTREVSVEDLTGVLLRKELLTNYQLDRLMKGERGGYFYGDYRVLYLIGSGTFARVYRSVQRSTGKIVAVKVLRKRFREDQSMTEQFLREGQIGAGLRHPSIVPIYEVSADLKTPYMVMEFVEGRNLREFTRVRKKLEYMESLKLAIDILAGLAYASTRGMQHRDLKMSNILVTSRGRAKLVDFGLASVQTKDEDDPANARTIDYAGLERASGVRNNDVRSDLFFTGCILYNMLTGIPPLAETRDRIQRLSLGRYQNIKPILDLEPELPKRLAQFVTRSLELNPERRFPSANEMHEEAKRLLVRLEAGDFSDQEVANPALARKLERKLEAEQEGLNRTLMVIESKLEMQDLLRDRLKKHGYRVLVFSDPERALMRFQAGDSPPADLVIFCTAELGEDSLDAFNFFGQKEHTKAIPAILFVDPRHSNFIKAAQVADHRAILTMPVKVRELRETLLKLLPPQTTVV